MTKINHAEVLQQVIAEYEKKHGVSGLEKADVDALVYGLGGKKGDIYKVMVLGMEHFFGDVMDDSMN
jgi:hypothetical protein